MNLLTQSEKEAILRRVIELKKTGREKEAMELYVKEYPIEATTLYTLKEVCGSGFIEEKGYNLSEAEAAYGTGWLHN